jgi:cadmium resistance protein CadD (predicted permease)
MSNNELIATLFGIITIVIALYNLGLREIERRKERDSRKLDLEEKKNAEHIKSVVVLQIKEHLDEMNKTFTNMYSMITKGELK